MSQHFFSGWGIRTVARGEARYNPMSYHNGSIWPHDNALIALGFARYGLKHSVAHLFKGLFDAASYMDLRRLPELFCGFQRERRRGPTLYPVACAPQAWASARAFTLLEAALGLEFDAARGEIRLRDPRLPAFLNEVVLRDLQLGPSSVDLRLRRHGEEVSLEVSADPGTNSGLDCADALMLVILRRCRMRAKLIVVLLAAMLAVPASVRSQGEAPQANRGVSPTQRNRRRRRPSR